MCCGYIRAALLALRPDWLKTRLPSGATTEPVVSLLRRLHLNTVCSSARCPNRGECWSQGTATFMILGTTCSRHCQFCAVNSGNPQGIIDPDEPQRIAEAVNRLGLSYVVITSVTRDDLPDKGAGQFAATIRAVNALPNRPRVEVLIPDFDARPDLLQIVLAVQPDVLAHNLETVEALTPKVRDARADYQRSLQVLRRAKRINPRQLTKSGLMLGLGETREQVYAALNDLRSVSTDILTLGQYLQPTQHNLPVAEYLTPEQFRTYQDYARQLGFRAVLAGPLVRSSFRAAETFSSLAACD